LREHDRQRELVHHPESDVLIPPVIPAPTESIRVLLDPKRSALEWCLYAPAPLAIVSHLCGHPLTSESWRSSTHTPRGSFSGRDVGSRARAAAGPGIPARGIGRPESFPKPNRAI